MTLTDYNDRNNTPLSNANILEAVRKFMEQESIEDSKNVTADKFSHVSNTQRENANTIFTSEKLDKLDELVDAIKKLTINDAEYYESNTETASDAQGNLTRNPETVTHTSNRIFEQELLSYWTSPVLPPPMNLLIDRGVLPIILASQMLLTPATKEVLTDAASGGAWVHRTPRK